METTHFNDAQIRLLRMFEHFKKPEDIEEVQGVLFKYYCKKLDEALDELWKSGKLNQERLDEINKLDLHKLPECTE